ncbi:hypothetical protein ES332_D11G325400v1 [Gossypium tomentosum]|uniref:Uncharacterized protein n=1 Tax=Gossypium tomentosum TaxID=34277 RepID=A0A5D2IWP9_GOSTO|nr:hypothetical protein ES332_D11G325400v1 [Gossypium tomentosum]
MSSLWGSKIPVAPTVGPLHHHRAGVTLATAKNSKKGDWRCKWVGGGDVTVAVAGLGRRLAPRV